ncbi:MAG: class I SAM-dependent methyltransferase [Thermoplasmata archaeon]
MYRACRKSLAVFTGVAPVALDGFFEELEPLHRALETEVGSLPASGALWQAPLLYVLIRAVQPRWMIETGISAGYSSRFLVEALERNGGEGHLDSIGIARFALGNVSDSDRQRVADRPIGWLVPPRFDRRWTRHVGRSNELLPSLLAGRAPELDVFLHDSLHDYPTMHYEYETVWSHVRPGGWLLSHDIHSSGAWSEFIATHAISNEVELDHDLGAARAPA